MTTLYLVRHGESVWNAAGIIQGQAEAPGLTPAGRAQAAAAADALAPLAVPAIWSSDAVRATETAEIIGSTLGIPWETTSLLRERNWGLLQGAAKDDALLIEALLPDGEPLPGGGESRNDLHARVRSFMATVTGDAIVVTHGDVVAAIGRLYGVAVAEGNAAVTEVAV